METSTTVDGSSFAVTPFSKRRGPLFLTKFEIAKVVGDWAVHIANGVYDDSASSGSLLGSGTVGHAPSVAALPSSIMTGRNHALAQVTNTTVYHNTNIKETAERCQEGVSLAHDTVAIAKYHLLQKRIPLIVRRAYPDGWVEHVPLSDLEVDITWVDFAI